MDIKLGSLRLKMNRTITIRKW